jgi:hypothetical protein
MEDLFGVRFIATGVPVERIDPALRPGELPSIARTKDAYVYENPRALPRVMLLNDWRVVDSEEQWAGFPENFDPGRVALLERPPPGLSRSDAGGTAHLVSYRNTEVVIEVDARGGGLLVLNDVWHPWWRANVDGAPAEILKANVLFRAVVVPPGRHVVTFTFHPFAGALAQLREKLSARWR